ncbi:MAG: hypothetical protein QXG25_01120 [Nitrososphaerota archaeon]
MRKSFFYIFSILFISVFLRLYPTIITGLPFSTDSWPLIRNSEKIMEFTPIPLQGEIFDGYNIYWPISQIFGVVSSEVLSVAPIDIMRLFIPFSASLSPLMIYLLVKRILNNELLSFMAGLLFAAGGPHAIFTAGVTKESFTSMLFLASLYFFLFSRGITGFLAFSVTSLAVIMGHHLTYVVLMVILVNIFFVEAFLPKLLKGSLCERVGKLVFLITAGLTYYATYASSGLKITLDFSDLLSAFSFQVILFVAMFYVVVRPISKFFLILWIFHVLAAFTGLVINQIRPFVAGSPQLSQQVFFYASMLIFLGLFAAIGMYEVKKSGVDKKLYPILFWLSSTLGLEAYAIFGANPSFSLVLTYRLPNFIIPAVGVMAAASTLANATSRTLRLASSICVVFLASTMLMQSYSAIILQENYLGYHWLYFPQDFQQALWIRDYGGDAIVYGDLKVAYLVKDYFGLRVDSAKGYAILAGNEKGVLDGLLMTYQAMRKNGYVLGHYGVELPRGWEEKLMGGDVLYSSRGNVICSL